MRRLAVLALLAALLPLTAPRALLPQNDAGSGRDAPNTADAGFRIAPNQVYDGTIEGLFLDEADVYAFDAPAGARIDARVHSGLGCLRLYDRERTQVDVGCAIAGIEGVVTWFAPYSGTYFVGYGYLQAHPYRFSLGVGRAAESPSPVELLGSGGAVPPVTPASQRDRHVVIAVVDTGINPYHEFFRAPALSVHPSKWLSGFPRTAETVRLTLDAPDHAAANQADAAKFDDLDLSTYNAGRGTFDEHLYTFPGTRVVGGISFGEYADAPILTPATARPVRDDHGHGTHSAGLAAGANLDRSDGNVLIVAVEVGKGTFDEGIRWAARQPWIDALSISLGVVANVPLAGVAEMTREAYDSGKPVFVAAGNGVTSTGLAPDKCSTYTSGYTGPHWVTRIGAAEPGDGSPTWWHCVPVDAIARTSVESPDHDVLRGGTSATGTSAATPNTAGAFAHLLLAARRVGANVTRAKVLDYLLRSAAPVALKPGASDPSVYPLSLADQGYGLVDQRALDDATTRLLTRAAPHARPETVEWFARDRAIRVQLWGS